MGMSRGSGTGARGSMADECRVSSGTGPRRGDSGDAGAQPSPAPAEPLPKRLHLPLAQPLAAGTAQWPLFQLPLGRYRCVHPLLQHVLLATAGFGRNDLSFLTDFFFSLK